MIACCCSGVYALQSNNNKTHHGFGLSAQPESGRPPTHLCKAHRRSFTSTGRQGQGCVTLLGSHKIIAYSRSTHLFASSSLRYTLGMPYIFAAPYTAHGFASSFMAAGIMNGRCSTIAVAGIWHGLLVWMQRVTANKIPGSTCGSLRESLRKGMKTT